MQKVRHLLNPAGEVTRLNRSAKRLTTIYGKAVLKSFRKR
jgi:hypothetical protein